MLRVTAALVTVLVSTAAAAGAGQGHCGRPVGAGEQPTSTDCLFILRAAVGSEDCRPSCICDTNGSAATTASDALLCLQVAVGVPGAMMDCGGNCPPDPSTLPCSSVEVVSLPGSTLDIGWTGLAHGSPSLVGATMNFEVLRRCSWDDSVCLSHDDCAGQGTCEPTCDCIDDSSCELAVPSGGKRCDGELTPCTTDAECRSTCVHVWEPPLPLSSAGIGVCAVTRLDGPLAATLDTATGEFAIDAALRTRLGLGNVDRPCPACGGPDEDPQIGQQFLCKGGARNGQACTVDAVTPYFGGVSYDCPLPITDVSEFGWSWRLGPLTTGDVERTATLPCGAFFFSEHPSRGSGVCTDDLQACDTNADCRRCDGDESVACASNADCGDVGPCGMAPEISVSCGFYCHCGFCEEEATGVQDRDAPCFADDECAAGFVCRAGNATTPALTPQQQPNQCTFTRCGAEAPEQCAMTSMGHCSEQPFRTCIAGGSTCEMAGVGTCVVEQLPCFEHRIRRSGSASPLGSYCSGGTDSDAACSSNTDCTEGVCMGDSMRPTTAALLCQPATSSSAVNSASGRTGPVAMRNRSFVHVCRCGDGLVGCNEECDDGNRSDGDGCSSSCRSE